MGLQSIRVVVAVAVMMLSVQATAGPSQNAATHYRQGVAYEKAGAFDQAIDEYKQAYALDRKVDHLFNIGRVYEQKNNLNEAIEFYDKFLAAAPNHRHAKDARQAVAIATKKLADEAKQLADETAAAERRRKSLEDEQERLRGVARAHLDQAAELERRGAWSAAAEEYERATLADSNHEHLLLAAEAYRRHPDLRKSKTALQRYLDNAPNGPRSDELRAKIADLARQIQEDEVTAKQQADAKLAARTERPPGPKARRRSRGWKLAYTGLGFTAVSGVFAYLGHRTAASIQEGTALSGNQVADKFSSGRTYNYLAYGAALVGLAGLAIGGVTIGVNLGDDPDAPQQVGLQLKGSL